MSPKKKTVAVATNWYRVNKLFHSKQLDRTLHRDEVVELEDSPAINNAVKLKFLTPTEPPVVTEPELTDEEPPEEE